MSTKAEEASSALRDLARAAGVECSYRGWDGQPVLAGARALRAVLAELGIFVDDPARIHEAQLALEREHWGEVVPPVLVAWAGATPAGRHAGVWVEVPMRVPADLDVPCELELVTERGARAQVGGRLYDASAHGHAWPASLGHRVHCVRRGRIEVPGGETGYHRLRWKLGLLEGESTVLAAPARAWGAPGDVPRRWGAFAPLRKKLAKTGADLKPSDIGGQCIPGINVWAEPGRKSAQTVCVNLGRRP